MPTYDFECDKCGKIWEEFYKAFSLKPETVACKCGGKAHQKIGATNIRPDVDGGYPRYDDGLETVIESRSHLKRVMAQKGLRDKMSYG